MILAKFRRMLPDQTITVNASCGDSQEVTANSKGRAKARFTDVGVAGCIIGVSECLGVEGVCPS